MGRIVDISEVLLDLGVAASPTEEEEAVVDQSIVRAEGAVKRFLRYDPLHAERTEFYPQRDNGSHYGDQLIKSGDRAVSQSFDALADELQLKHFPIRSNPTPQVWIDRGARFGTAENAFSNDTKRTHGSDFWANYDQADSADDVLCMDGILKSAGTWPTTPGSIKVTYTAGYKLTELHGQDSVIDASPILAAIIDEALRRAVKVLASKKHARVGFTAGVLASERLGNYAYTLNNNTTNTRFGDIHDITPENKERLEAFVSMALEL